jgi:PAS domain S-box-containing protein
MSDPLPYSAKASVAETRRALNRRIAQLFFGLGLGVSLCGALLYLGLPMALTPAMRALMVGACLAQAGCFGIGMALRPSTRLPCTVLGVCAAGTVVTALTGVASGDGLHTLSLSFFGLLVCLVTLLASLRSGIVLALASGTAAVVLAMAERQGDILSVSELRFNHPMSLNLLTLLVIVGTALAAGALMSRMFDRALAAAEEREERFLNLLRIGADWYWELDADLRFLPTLTALSPHVVGMRETRIGKRPWEINQVDWTPEQLALHRGLLEAHQPLHELPLQRRDEDGQVHFYVISGQPRFDADGQFLGYWGIGRDQTAEVRSRQAARASEARYRELFARSPSPLILHRRSITVDANDAAAKLFGYASADAMIGADLVSLTSPGDHRERAQQRSDALEAMPVSSALEVADFEMQAIDGARLFVQATAVRVNTSDTPASLSIYFDITARVAAESALRRSEAMLSHLFATSPDFITMSDMLTGRYVMVNRSFSRIFGVSAAEAIGKTSFELGVWKDDAARKRMIDQLIAHGGVHDMPAWGVHASGAPVSVMMSAGRFQMDGRDYLVVNGRDVTEAQRARLEQETILQNASIGIALVRDQRLMRANPSFERMFGWERGALIGEPGSVLWPDHAEFAETRQQIAARLSGGEPVEIERLMRHRDGSTFWCRLLAQVVDPLHPDQAGTIWIAEDVTERRRVEQALAAARDAAEAASRAKSAFLANTSHEIRTPLNGLLGLARLAMQPGVEEERRSRYLEQIHDSARSLADIISDILDLSKIEAGKFSIESVPFDLRRLLFAVHHAYGSLADGRSLMLDLQIDDDVPTTVRGDPVRLRQILSNYITNGLKFTERGQVRIEAALAEPGVVRLTVSDTGPGIPEDVQQRLFQPFVQADGSTTRRYGGTGLGLSICKELATLMGGRCGVHSQPGEGSRFWAELPLPVAEALAVDPAVDAEDGARLAGVDVLLVEDNLVNMMIGVAMLQQWGVNVVQALDGHEAVLAVDRAAQAGHPFDAVLMDVQMPRLSGHEAAAQLRTRYPSKQLPIIALTAAALVSEREQALAAGMDDFLTKPIDPAKLRQALSKALARRSTTEISPTI